VALFDTLLDASLKEKFKAEDVEAFNTTFDEKKELYNAMNSTVYETIWSIVNFEYFKSEIIKFKAILGKKSEELNAAPKLDLMRINEQVFHELEKEDLNDTEIGWMKSFEMTEETGKGCSSVVYSRPTSKTNPMLVCRTDSVMRDVSIDAFFEFVKNMDEYVKQSPHILEYKTLEESDDGNTKIIYWRSKMPNMSERDSVMSAQKITYPNG
jgi:hypothetical protein